MATKIEFEINKPSFLPGGNWKLRNLNRINILFGKNGSGKSELLRALKNQEINNCRYIVPERAGDIKAQPNLVSRLRNSQSRESQSNSNFQNDYRQQVITRIDNYFRSKGINEGEAGSVKNKELESILNSLLSDFEFRFKDDTNPFELIRSIDSGNGTVDNINKLSSGETQLFTIGLDILITAAEWELNTQSYRLLLLDEPDAHIHPDLISKLSDFINQVSIQFNIQVLVATHSTDLLSAMGTYASGDASILYMNKDYSELEAQIYDDLKSRIGASLGGHTLMGALFDVPILLVEGDDDFRIWSQVSRHHVVNLSVVPCQGEQIYQYQEDLEKLFSALLEVPDEPIGYALLDNDKGKKQPTAENPQNYIQFIQLKCHEAENLYLTDEVLSDIGIDWTDASDSINDKAGQFGNKEDELKKLAVDSDRISADYKNVIKEIEKCIDPKNVLWSQRVGQVIGKSVPTGQLREFLGEEVCDAIWKDHSIRASDDEEE
ncbi:MAG: ATP-dependent nuclease [Bacteroidota bacterium]